MRGPDARQRKAAKMETLAPHIEKAFARKKYMKALSDDEIPNVVALGRQITQPLTAEEEAGRTVWSETAAVPLEDPAKKRSAAE